MLQDAGPGEPLIQTAACDQCRPNCCSAELTCSTEASRPWPRSQLRENARHYQIICQIIGVQRQGLSIAQAVSGIAPRETTGQLYVTRCTHIPGTTNSVAKALSMLSVRPREPSSVLFVGAGACKVAASVFRQRVSTLIQSLKALA